MINIDMSLISPIITVAEEYFANLAAVLSPIPHGFLYCKFATLPQ